MKDPIYTGAHVHHLMVNCTHAYCAHCGKGLSIVELGQNLACLGCLELAFDLASGDDRQTESDGMIIPPPPNAPGPQDMHRDAGKPPIGLISPLALVEEAKVMAHGAKKYAEHRWRGGISWQGVLNSLARHWVAYNRGETLDPESGLSHMAHVRCDAGFLLEYEVTHPEFDDRHVIADREVEATYVR